MTTTSDKKPLGLYIHIPFCYSKCAYCDFVSHPINDFDTHAAYIRKLVYELRTKKSMFADGGETAPLVDTVYIGGGTPSFIQSMFIMELLDAIYASYRVTDDAEITIEVNPGTVDDSKLRVYRSCGVNRLSIGAQSFRDEELAFLGRTHRPAAIRKCVFDARAVGFKDINLDLMFGIPGQELSGWEETLRGAVALEPTHISFYSLGIEQETPLYERYVNGDFEAMDEIADRVMYHTAKEYLAGHGLFQYEISNSAREGMKSRHNLKYWSMERYAGFGVSAHSYFGGRRFSNTENLADYLSAEDTVNMTNWEYENTPSDEMSEFIFLGLRLTTGIALSRFRGRFGADFWELYGKEAEKLINNGLLEHIDDRLRLTSLGLDLANIVFSEFV